MRADPSASCSRAGRNVMATSGIVVWGGGEALPKAGRVCPQGEQSLDLDAMPANPIKDAVGKTANQGAPDIWPDHRKRLRVLKDLVKGVFDAKREIIAETRTDV